MTEQVVVAMLDDRTRILHRPGDVHLVTACGIPLEETTVGPFAFVHQRAAKICPDCYDVPDVGQPPLVGIPRPGWRR